MWLSRTLLHLIMSGLADASGKSGYGCRAVDERRPTTASRGGDGTPQWPLPLLSDAPAHPGDQRPAEVRADPHPAHRGETCPQNGKQGKQGNGVSLGIRRRPCAIP